MGLASVVSGLINSERGLPTVDIRPLLDTINRAGANQRQLINSLPPEIQKNLAEYATSLGEGGAQYKSAIEGLSQSMQQKAGQIYGADSAAAGLAKDQSKKDIYSTLPGTQNAIRNALAATGGLGRGSAATALAAPSIQAAQEYGRAASGIDADQAKMGQQAQQQALTAAANMEASMFQNMFGMTKEQATQILSSGNAALSNQLAQLINQSNNETNQTLGVQGIAANNGYQNAVTRNGQQGAITAGLVDLGVNGMQQLMSGGMPSPSSGAASSPYADLNYANA